MLIRPPSGRPVVTEKHHVCTWHKEHPGDVSYAGCGCVSFWGLRYEPAWIEATVIDEVVPFDWKDWR